jgi:hypothetical protein
MRGETALHLTRDPSTKTMAISDVMDKFNLPDLRGTLADFSDHVNNEQPLRIGCHRAANADSPLSFDCLQVWTKVQVQNRSYHAPHCFSPPKQSTLFSCLGNGPLGTLMLFSSIQIATKFGLRVASKVFSFLYPSHLLLNVLIWFQGIISPNCVLFFMQFHLEELHILLVQIYFSLMLSVSTLYLS